MAIELYAAKFLSRDDNGINIFNKLVNLTIDNQYGDEYLNLLDQYSCLYPESEYVDIFAGCYACFYGDADAALEYAAQAYSKRSVNKQVWQLLAKCYDAKGDIINKIKYQVYCKHLYGMKIILNTGDILHDGVLDQITMADNIANYAPFLINRAMIINGKFEQRKSVPVGEFIINSEDECGYKYWLGAYVNQEILNAKGNLCQRESSCAGFVDDYAADFVFDVMRGKLVKNYDFDPHGENYILPLGGNCDTQQVMARFDGNKRWMILGNSEVAYCRINRPVQFSCEKDFVVGKPILLKHNKNRKKLVLNILIDALSWTAVKESDYSMMPETVKFFERGVIFNQHFSVHEYTYPSLATIETGMYAHHSQLFNEKVNIQLDKRHKTMSEMMQDLGYHCVNVMGCGSGLYNGVTRGHDHMIINPYALRAYEGVERCIQQLEAFGECDQFIFMHIMDTHPWPVQSIQIPLATQTKLSIEDRTIDNLEKINSVYLGYSPLYKEANICGIRNVDKSLKVLFDYLESHYSDDEYIVQLYSDHGCSVYDDFPRLMSDYQTGSAYMVRGAGVPEVGFADELTSAVDIYPVTAKLAGCSYDADIDGNLPAVFGGKAREYVYSNAMYPNQTYKLCIRDQKYAFNLESKEPLEEDGTVNLNNADMFVLERGMGLKQNLDEDVLKRFMKEAHDFTNSFNNGGRKWPDFDI